MTNQASITFAGLAYDGAVRLAIAGMDLTGTPKQVEAAERIRRSGLERLADPAYHGVCAKDAAKLNASLVRLTHALAGKTDAAAWMDAYAKASGLHLAMDTVKIMMGAAR